MSVQSVDPYERIATRLTGIKHISTLAAIAASRTPVDLPPAFWCELLSFTGQLADDIDADAQMLHCGQVWTGADA